MREEKGGGRNQWGKSFIHSREGNYRGEASSTL